MLKLGAKISLTEIEEEAEKVKAFLKIYDILFERNVQEQSMVDLSIVTEKTLKELHQSCTTELTEWLAKKKV